MSCCRWRLRSLVTFFAASASVLAASAFFEATSSCAVASASATCFSFRLAVVEAISRSRLFSAATAAFASLFASFRATSAAAASSAAMSFADSALLCAKIFSFNLSCDAATAFFASVILVVSSDEIAESLSLSFLRALRQKKNGYYRHTLTGKVGGKPRNSRVTICVASKSYTHKKTGKRRTKKLLYAIWKVRLTPRKIREMSPRSKPSSNQKSLCTKRYWVY